MNHYLKISTEFFEPVLSNIKTFEIRFNDRNYKVGDILVLKEYDSLSGKYTGRFTERKVVYITDYEQHTGYIVMSIV